MGGGGGGGGVGVVSGAVERRKEKDVGRIRGPI